MDTTINPAAQLLDVMKDLKDYNGDASTLAVWARVLGLKPSDVLGVSKAILGIGDLSVLARKAVELHVFGDPAMYLKPFSQIDDLLADLDLARAWKQQSYRIDDAMIMGLRFADHFLSNSIENPTKPDLVTATSLASSVDSLLEDCLKSDLDDELKTFFADILDRLRSSLNQFKIYGSTAFDQSLDEIVGAINRRRIKFDVQTEEAKGFIARIFDTIGKANDLVSASDTVAKLATSGAVFFLPHLS